MPKSRSEGALMSLDYIFNLVSSLSFKLGLFPDINLPQSETSWYGVDFAHHNIHENHANQMLMQVFLVTKTVPCREFRIKKKKIF